MKKHVFILSGLGADERVFHRLRFPSDCEITHVKWIAPEKDEAIEHYAQRLLSQITTPNPIIIGLSFGGMMTMEIAKLIPTEKIILLASAKTKHELPALYRKLGKSGILNILPQSLMQQTPAFVDDIFGVHTEEDKQLLHTIIKETPPQFLRWALQKIIYWENETIPKKAFHIHGDKDKILPIKCVKCDYTVKEGTHFMTLDKHEEISKILEEQIAK